MATKPPALVDQFGRPLRKELLGQEIAAPTRASVRTIQSGHPAQGLDPARLGRILRDAEDGDAVAYFELAEEMEEKDLHYLSVLGTRKRAVAQLPIEVEPADDSEQAKEDAALIEDWLDRDMLEHELFDLLDAVGKGVSTVEIVWEMTSKAWLPRALHWRDPRWFEFDRVNGWDLLLRGGEDGTSASSPLPAAKFITHFHPAKSGLPIRSGLARIAAWGYMFKNYALKDWVSFLEGYGHPLRIGKYGPNESEENKAILWRAIRDLGSDAAATFPETMNVEFVDRKAGTAPNDLWRSMAEYIDLQLSKAVLGQTNTTDAQAGGLGSGQANVHNEVRGDIERADAKLLAASLNRDLVVPMVMLNRGPREKYPRIRIGRPDPVDIKTEIESAEKLEDRGVVVDWEAMRERAGVPAGSAAEEETSAANGDDGAAGGSKIQQLALNGAQVKSLLEMVVAISDRTITADAGHAMIRIAFPAVASSTIDELVAGALKAQPEPAPQKPVEGPGRESGPPPRKNPATGLLDRLKSLPEGDRAELNRTDIDGSREPDAIELTADQALEDWDLQMEPLLAEVDRLVGEATDLSELQQMLAPLTEQLDPALLARRLGMAMFSARLAGEGDAPADRQEG